MHEEIRSFTHEGIIADDKYFIRVKDNMQRVLEDSMRIEGFVPVIDMDVGWSTQLRDEDRGYAFKITMYGVFVGEDKDCEKIAYSGGKIIQIK